MRKISLNVERLRRSPRFWNDAYKETAAQPTHSCLVRKTIIPSCCLCIMHSHSRLVTVGNAHQRLTIDSGRCACARTNATFPISIKQTIAQRESRDGPASGQKCIDPARPPLPLVPAGRATWPWRLRQCSCRSPFCSHRGRGSEDLKHMDNNNNKTLLNLLLGIAWI